MPLPNSQAATSLPYADRVDDGFPSDLQQFLVTEPASQRYSMEVVTPRPDSETGNLATDGFDVRARYRWAYYDGVNSVRYELPLKVFGGSSPHIFQLISGPAGATVGNSTTGDVIVDSKIHGVVKWSPTQEYSTASPATFVVRIWASDMLYVDATWTVATTDSLQKFMFTSLDSGNDTTGTGAIDSPFATLTKLTGTTTVDTTYPHRIVYLRGSTTAYATAPHSDCWDKNAGAAETIPARMQLDPSFQPNQYLSYPDEDVSLDFALAEIMFENSDDITMMGSSGAQLTILGSSNNAAETHNFWFNEGFRGLIAFIDFDGFIPRTNSGYTNSAPMFSVSVTDVSVRQYWGLHDVHEINRTASAANDALLHVFFGTNYFVEDFCGGARTAGTGCAYKDRNYNTSVRYGFYDADLTSNLAFAFMDQNGGGNNEIVFSGVRGILWFNFQATSSGVGDHFAARCTVYSDSTSFAEAVKVWFGSTTGPYGMENCVLMSRVAPFYSTDITSVGNEVQVSSQGGDIPINLDTLDLVNDGTAWRDLYLGTRGREFR